MQLIRDAHVFAGKAQQRIAAHIRFVILTRKQHLDAGDDEEHREEIEHPMIVSDDCGAKTDHDATQNDDTENAPEKDTVLIFARDSEEAEYQRDDKDIVERQRLSTTKAVRYCAVASLLNCHQTKPEKASPSVM